MDGALRFCSKWPPKVSEMGMGIEGALELHFLTSPVGSITCEIFVNNLYKYMNMVLLEV